MSDARRPLLPHISEVINSTEASSRATSRIEIVLASLEEDFAGDHPDWYSGRETFARALIERAPTDFCRAFDRWRDLLAAAERAVELATLTLNDYSISPQDRKASENRLAMGNWQRKTLLQSKSTQNNDFYLYRYLATEASFPGTTSLACHSWPTSRAVLTARTSAISSVPGFSRFRVWPAEPRLP